LSLLEFIEGLIFLSTLSIFLGFLKFIYLIDFIDYYMIGKSADRRSLRFCRRLYVIDFRGKSTRFTRPSLNFVALMGKVFNLKNLLNSLTAMLSIYTQTLVRESREGGRANISPRSTAATGWRCCPRSHGTPTRKGCVP